MTTPISSLSSPPGSPVPCAADLDEEDRRVEQRRDLQHIAMVADVPEPVVFQNGHAALRPSSITFMTVKVASVKPPIV
jgi:hypothetical protein